MTREDWREAEVPLLALPQLHILTPNHCEQEVGEEEFFIGQEIMEKYPQKLSCTHSHARMLIHFSTGNLFSLPVEIQGLEISYHAYAHRKYCAWLMRTAFRLLGSWGQRSVCWAHEDSVIPSAGLMRTAFRLLGSWGQRSVCWAHEDSVSSAGLMKTA